MAGDAIEVAPHAYKVMFENERVRVLENHSKPGETTETHAHPAVVGVAVTGGKFRFTTVDGQPVEAELKPGEVLYMEAVEHATENIGEDEAHVVIVELK